MSEDKQSVRAGLLETVFLKLIFMIFFTGMSESYCFGSSGSSGPSNLTWSFKYLLIGFNMTSVHKTPLLFLCLCG